MFFEEIRPRRLYICLKIQASIHNSGSRIDGTPRNAKEVLNLKSVLNRAPKMIYPDIETFRRNSETLDAMPEFKPHHLEKNYNQIFMKGPALTKDFLEKMNTDIVPKKTYLFGYELNTKKILCKCRGCLHSILNSKVIIIFLHFFMKY